MFIWRIMVTANCIQTTMYKIMFTSYFCFTLLQKITVMTFGRTDSLHQMILTQLNQLTKLEKRDE